MIKKLLIDPQQNDFIFAYLTDGVVSFRGRHALLEAIASFADVHGVTDVLIDEGYRTSEVRKAAQTFGWTTVMGRSGVRGVGGVASILTTYQRGPGAWQEIESVCHGGPITGKWEPDPPVSPEPQVMGNDPMGRVIANCAAVKRILRSGGTLEDCIVELFGRLEESVAQNQELSGLAPMKYILPDGRVLVWHCPAEFIPDSRTLQIPFGAMGAESEVPK